jgi:hypothetical protein
VIYKRGDLWHMDAMVSGVRYREALHTSDRREASRLEKGRIAAILAGKSASKSGRAFARLPFGQAADRFCGDRALHVSARTSQLDRERLRPLRQFFGERPLARISADDIAAYQRVRVGGELSFCKSALARRGVSNRTVNMELGVLRLMLASDATVMALAGHLSRAMLEHYSHIRMAAKRTALDSLSTGAPPDVESASRATVGPVH